MQIKNKRIISLLKILSEKSQSMTGRYLAESNHGNPKAKTKATPTKE